MKNITISNIENYMHMFNAQNDKFYDIKWVEPIFIAMIRAYQNEEQIDILTNNQYLKSMINNEFKEGKTYSPLREYTIETD